MSLKLSYLNILKKPIFSEKSNFLLNNNKTLVFKVKGNVNKIEILSAVQKILNLKVKKVRTLWIKTKKKIKKNGIINYSKKWKKAYIILKENQNVQLDNLLK